MNKRCRHFDGDNLEVAIMTVGNLAVDILTQVTHFQGDQIGRIFAQWFTFGRFILLQK
jgi:hypothetical protein